MTQPVGSPPVLAAAPSAPVVPEGSPVTADLVLEGGGVKGIGLVGAVLALHEAGYGFRRVAGTSAGAIAAALIAAMQTVGQPLAELQGYLQHVDYSQFERKSPLRAALGRVGDAGQLLLHMGLYDGDYLLEWLGDLLRQLGVTTFADLHSHDDGLDRTLTDDQRYSLVVHTADITRGKLVRLPWDYAEYGLVAAEQPIVDAVRASMSIPFFFDPVRFQARAATVNGVSYPDGRVTWVDGGLLSNFPVEVFDRADGQPSRWPTIGIKLSARSTVYPPGRDPDDTFDEALGCLHTLLSNADRYYLSPDKVARTIFVDNAGIKATDFHLSAAQQQTLFDNGRAAAVAYLAAARQPA